VQDRICKSLNRNLSTPVSTVWASIEMLRDDVISRSQNDSKLHLTNLFDVIGSSMNVINAQLNDYLDYFSLKQNIFQCKFQRINLKETISQITESYSLQARVRLISFSITWLGELPACITTDKNRLQ